MPFNMIIYFIIVIMLGCSHSSPKATQLISTLSSSLDQASQNLSATGVLYEEDQKSLVILPGSSTPLNRLANELADRNGVRLIYDPSFYSSHPGAAAAFDKIAKIVYLPESLLQSGDIQDPTLLHELVHVHAWQRLNDGISSPYDGLLTGDPFAPARLDLDEMEAYDHDLRLAIHNFRHIISATPKPRLLQKRERFRKIAELRLAEKPALENLDELENAWDAVCKKAMHGKGHTEPVVQYLPAFLKNNPKITYSIEERSGIISGVAALIENSEHISAQMFFPIAHDPIDLSGEHFFLGQIRWTLSVAKKHLRIFNNVQNVIRRVALGTNSVDETLFLKDLVEPLPIEWKSESENNLFKTPS